MKQQRPTLRDRRPRRGRTRGALLLAAAALAGACSKSGPDSDVGPTWLRGTVTGPTGVPVVGATVYLVPTTAVATTPITPASVLDGSAEAFDEPLEDAVAAQGASFTRAVTDDDGGYDIGFVPEGAFYLYVEPGAADAEHLPGGSFCRTAGEYVAFRGTTRDVVLSSSPPDTAQFAGMSSCLVCHDDLSSTKGTAHRLGFRVPGVSSDLQDTDYHPEVDLGLEYFLEAADHTGGTPVYHYDPDFAREPDAFKTSLEDPATLGEDTVAILWLWRVGDEHRITIENVANPTDPRSPATRAVELTYGGTLGAQRYMIDWPGRNGLYPLLQFQTEGDEERYDRTRKVFRDYDLDDYWDRSGTDEDVSDDLIADPAPELTIQRNCMGCHATAYSQFTDDDTGEVLCSTLTDPNGEYDIDGDGYIDDINVSCEGCHGPGSRHIEVTEARYILSPEYLSPSRGNQLCGRCHDRQAGADPNGTPHAFSADGRFPPPGISRRELLADYVAADAKGPPESVYWPYGVHARVNQQQFSDMLRSVHYRNPEQLLTCSSCHDVHGGTGYPDLLLEDPLAPDTPLCMICHGAELGGTGPHTLEVTGWDHDATYAACTQCHMSATGQRGSGRYGYLLSPPTGTEADASETYYENDVGSHLFDVPRKDDVGVVGVLPIDAMPIPYTRSCAFCHDPSELQDG